MATPTGIVLANNDVIIEASAGDSINQFISRDFAGGYARQIGALVTSCDVDDYVQYNKTGSAAFIQDGVTYVWTTQDKIFFVQEPAP